MFRSARAMSWRRQLRRETLVIVSTTLFLLLLSATMGIPSGQEPVAATMNTYDLAGKELWNRPLGLFQKEHGVVASPVIADGKLFLVADVMHEPCSSPVAADSKVCVASETGEMAIVSADGDCEIPFNKDMDGLLFWSAPGIEGPDIDIGANKCILAAELRRDK